MSKNSDVTFFFLMVILTLAFSIGTSAIVGLHYGLQNLNAPVDASIVNGMLTATAIVFAFVTFEARDIEPYRPRFFLSGLLVVFLFLTGLVYFGQVMDPSVGHPTKLVLVIAMANFYFNILSSINAMYGRKLLAK
jgi:cation transport ATPase